METLRKQIDEYVNEINQLKNVVQKLSHENTELKTKYSANEAPASATTSTTAAPIISSVTTTTTTTNHNYSVYDEPL